MVWALSSANGDRLVSLVYLVFLVLLVYLVCLVFLVYLVCLVRKSVRRAEIVN